jgi:hypothetical protein
VARPGNELAARVEESAQVRAHLVEGRGELCHLGRSPFGRARIEVSLRELDGRFAHSIDRVGDRSRHQKRGDQSRQR